MIYNFWVILAIASEPFTLMKDSWIYSEWISTLAYFIKSVKLLYQIQVPILLYANVYFYPKIIRARFGVYGLL